jgi:Yip1 domain.
MDDRSPLPSAPSLGKVLPDVFASPSEVFQSLKNTAPSPILWVMPLIATLLIVIMTSIMLFTNESLKAEMKDIQSKTFQKRVDEGKLTQEQADKAETNIESMGGMMIAIVFVGGAIFMVAFYFGGALFLWLANKTILKSAVGYGKHLEMYGIASWIGVLGGIITVLMMVGLGSSAATPSGALVLLGSFDPTNKLHMLLASLNIFSIWQTAVIGIGLSKLSDKQTGAGMGVAFALWIVWVALSILLGIAR